MTDPRPDSDPAGKHGQPPPIDWVSPQFTLRAVLTGMLLGAVLCMCNIYSGLKIGWGFNMSVTAALLSFGFWNGARRLSGNRIRHWGILENNINQTACSSGAMVSSAGLVAPIPALAILTGQTLTWPWLALWCFSVMMVGIVVAIPLRRQMLVVDKLPFAFGIAAAETLREMYAKGAEAVARITHLISAGVVASIVTILAHFKVLGSLFFPVSVQGFAASTLTLSLRPSLLLVGVGGLIGIRACLSLLLGALLAYAVIAPPLIHSGNLELQVAEALDRPPPGMALAIGDVPGLTYDYDRQTLVFSGVMSAERKEELLALNDYTPYQKAIRKLYARSQIAWQTPLAALPPGLDLQGTPLEFDARRGALVATAALSASQVEGLAAASEDESFRAALHALHREFFLMETVGYVQISEPLETFPPGLVIPRDLEGVLQYARDRNRLVLRGPFSEKLRERLLGQLQDYRGAHPGRTAEADAFEAALQRLERRQAEAPLPAGLVWPAELTVARFDDELKALRMFGVPDERQQAELRALAVNKDDPHDFDFRHSVNGLISSAVIKTAKPGFRDLNRWLLWPGVTLMVIASLVSVAFSWRSFLNAMPWRASKRDATVDPSERDDGGVPMKLFAIGLFGALVLSVVLQVGLFEIIWWAAVVGVLLTFLLALVAARVSGETSITPVGAMGKVTQLIFGVLVPKSAAANLMAANVTGGAASQCADLLHDLKCGWLLGAVPRYQTLAQIFGAMAGALSGAAVYLILVPNPGEMLLTEEWAAPAVAAWKAVAELFMVGFEAIPKGTPLAMAIAGAAGILLPIIERKVPKKHRWAIPSAASVGLAFVIQAYSSFAIFLGGVVALILGKLFPNWSARFLVAVCAGVVAGESLTGVGLAIENALRTFLG